MIITELYNNWVWERANLKKKLNIFFGEAHDLAAT